ncbi:SusD/RagB family nutrient-binding outer membrane lipoprotein [Paracnuella aquatica]|uniref:SusD/RagB family nutrient-binding outer membrane lipoprotein n=1 Tax=Paracnuella aquatica TaxID=2268757 RepID=UPI000DEF57E2|nr:SusD/RagB family nutrient-binding outer membrane lipoprotein [Paracnuella aquatica]RPD44245.1 SusD/RagB family nutrient-binding outer membrane lipoprotein [Paracnuella aquatica]
MNRFIYKGLAAILLLTGATSCEKTLDINKDPNFPTVVDKRLLLPAAQVQLGYTIGGTVNRIAGNIIQHYGGHRNQPLQYNQYDIGPAESDGIWSAMYAVVLRDLKGVQVQARATGDSMYVGVSQLLMAYSYSVLTDLYGDIPFSEALMDDANLTPKYDRQEDIYPALVSMIDAGVANVQSGTGGSVGTDDLMYGGNMQRWAKFGNSLKLRLLNHLSKRQPGAAAAFLNTSPALISANNENAQVVYGSSSANANPVYGFDVLSGRKDMAVATTIIDKMKALSDPRIPRYFLAVKTGTNAGQYLGNIPGGDEDDAGESLYSRVGPAYASINSPVVLLSLAEVQFIIAEVRLREGKTAEAATAYNAAITADFNALSIGSEAAGYLAKPAVAFNNTLQRIIEQKWITMLQGSYEAWVDWRRTGFPALTGAAVSRTNGIIPRSLPLPQLEINLNRQSLEAGPGVPVPIEALKERVWWDAP